MLKFLEDEKAQGSIEYLLIVAAAIALAAVIIFLVLFLGDKGIFESEERLDDFNCLAQDFNAPGC